MNKKERVKERTGDIKREENIVNHKERVNEKMWIKKKGGKILQIKKKERVETNKEKK